MQGSPCHSLMHDVKHACLSLLTPWCYCAPSGVGVESSPCSPLQGWPCLQGSPLLTLPRREKPTARAPAYSAESALLLAARAVPSAPPLSTTAVAAVLKKRSHASILSFCTSFSQLSRYGLATPSSHDGCCAGAPICRQPVLRTLCFTNRWNHHLSSVFIYLTNSPFGLHVYHLHWVSSLGR